MSLTTGPDADNHPHQAAATNAQANYLLTHDSKGFPVVPCANRVSPSRVWMTFSAASWPSIGMTS